MTIFFIFVLVAMNIAQFLNSLDLNERLKKSNEPKTPLVFHFGVTPKSMSEGTENAAHRKPSFPKLP